MARDKKNNEWIWAILITVVTFFICTIFSMVSELLLGNANLVGSLLVLLSFILIGIVSDMVGTAVASANEAPFNAMAANKVKSAKQAVFLVMNAAKVSNILNDVVGDICGIISGVTSATILIQIMNFYSFKNILLIGIILNGIVAAITVGGKAAGKHFAMTNTNEIIYKTAVFIDFFNVFKKGSK